MSLANTKEREHIAVPKPRGVLAVHATVRRGHGLERFPELHIDFDFAGTRRDENATILPDWSTHSFTQPSWWSGMHAMLLDSTAPHSASSKSMSDDERKRRAEELKRQSNAARASTKSERRAGVHAVAGIVIGHTVQDIVRALRPFGPKQALLNLLAKLARQADAAIGTCQGGDVGLLNMGLLSMTQDGAQARMARKPDPSVFYESYGVKYDQKTDGISRHRVAGPTLTIILTCEWLLAAATATEPVAGTPTVKALFEFLMSQLIRKPNSLERLRVETYNPSLQEAFRIWRDAEIRAFRRMQKAVQNVVGIYPDTSVSTVQALLRAAKMAAWPMNETLDVEQQPRLLQVVDDKWFGDETYGVGIKLKGYKPAFSYDVNVQFEDSSGHRIGSPRYVSSLTSTDALCVLQDEARNYSDEYARSLFAGRLYTFYIGEHKIDGTLGDVVSWEQAIDDETPIPIVCKRDYAYARFVEEKFPEWECLGATVDEPIEDVAPSAAVAAEDAATRALLAAKLIELKHMHEPPEHVEPAEHLKCADRLKAARCLHFGGQALAASDADSFEFASAMLCPDGVAPMFATQMLKCIIDDLNRRRETDDIRAPAIGKPADRKPGRHYNDIVLCSTPEHRIVLADCLLDAYTAFTTETAEAKAACATFKPAIPRPNGQKGAASATDA
jgi:hypothetical protein